MGKIVHLLFLGHICIVVETDDLGEHIGNQDQRQKPVRKAPDGLFRQYSHKTGKRCMDQFVDSVEEHGPEGVQDVFAV